VWHARLERAGAKRKTLATLYLEPGRLDSRAGFPRGVTATGDCRPKTAAVRKLEHSAQRLAAREHVLIEAKLSTRPHHTVKLRERRALVGHAAQDQAGHGRIELLVLRRQGLGAPRGDGHGNAEPPRRVFGGRAQRRLGLDRQNSGYSWRVVREVQTVARAELDDAPAQPLEQPAPVVAGTAALGALGKVQVHPREARVWDVAGAAHLGSPFGNVLRINPPGVSGTVSGMATTTTHGYTATQHQIQTRLRRIEGQVRGVQGMVDDDRYCIDVLTQISAIQAALDKVALGLVDEHTRHCVIDANRDERAAKTDELMGAVARLMRRG
jgi:DNA-binding FrmR family transcriptional regulator